jgi:FHA domain
VEFDALRAAVVPGAAVVGRWPGIVCVAECADRQVLRQLLEVCASTAGPEPGRALARRLTMWLGGADAPGDGLRFGTVAVAGGDGRSAALRGEQWAVFLYGPVGLVVPDRQVALSGAQAVAWTDRLLPRPDVPVVLALEGGPIPPGVIDGVHDLRSGVVPGAGAVLVPGGGDALGADGAEETARYRPDDPLWVEPADRERTRWSGGSPEPALAAPPDGLFHAGDGPGNGVPGRNALEDLAPDVTPDGDGEPGTGLAADRTRFGDRGRAHLRPVPSGSNGIAHRGRGSRRAPTFDLGRFGGGPARRDTSGAGVADNGDRGPGAPPGGEAGESGPPGGDQREPAADDGPTLHNEVPARGGDETSGDLGFAAPGIGVNDTGVNGTGRNGSGLNGSGLNGSGLSGSGLNGSGVRDAEAGDAGIPGAGVNGTGRNGLPGLSALDAPFGELPRDETPAQGSSALDGGLDDGRLDAAGPDIAWPDRAEGHWFATRHAEPDTEIELGSVPPPDDRRPRHGRQEAGPPAEPDDEDDEAAAGTPRLGVRTVPPAALPAAAPAPPPAPEPVPEPPTTDPTPLRAEQILGAPAEPPRAPLEAGAPAGVAVETPEGPLDASQVHGHLCPRGHLNDPRLSLCAFCGSRLEETGGQLVAGPRPALGLIVFDDGTTYTVDAEYLVGRMPEGDPRVAAGALRSLAVEDPSGAVSRVHAEVRLAGWDVLLTDVGSRNGTFFSGPADPEWTQLPSGQTHRLVPGTRVRLGGRSFLFESPSGAR